MLIAVKAANDQQVVYIPILVNNSLSQNGNILAFRSAAVQHLPQARLRAGRFEHICWVLVDFRFCWNEHRSRMITTNPGLFVGSLYLYGTYGRHGFVNSDFVAPRF